MESKPLRQLIDTTLDTAGMSGPFRRRDIAERVYRSAPDDYWTLADAKEARVSWLMDVLHTRMTETHSQQFIDQYFSHLPDEVIGLLGAIPRFICISAGGGREAEHVMSVMATPEHWDANFKLKDRIAKATMAKRNEARSVRDLLVANRVQSLMEFVQREAAE